MKIAITGGSGLIGKAFIKRYSKELDIVEITRTPNKLGCVYSDYSTDSLLKIFDGVDGVIHLAGQRLHNIGDSNSNTTLDQSVFEAAKKSNIYNVVYASSRGIYGDSESPWLESSDICPNNLYALGKAQSELLAMYLNRTQNMNIKCLRIAQVLSNNEYKGSMIKTFLDKATKGDEIEVSVKGIYREYIYIDDLITAIHSAIKETAISGIYNVGTGEGITVLDIAKTISRSFNSKSLVKNSENLSTINEISIMDIKLFCQIFSWKPRFSFDSAIEDIKRIGRIND
jgi:UDP-glucose 4-epimerase